MEAIVSALARELGNDLVLYGGLYAVALAIVCEAIKRSLVTLEGNERVGRLAKVALGQFSWVVLCVGMLSGAAVWPEIASLASVTPADGCEGASKITPQLGAILGVATAGLAHMLYPLVLERVMMVARLKPER